MAKYTVTGGSGFIGQALVEELVSNGNQVICISKSSKIRSHERLRVVSSETATFAEIVNEMAGSDAVFHLATYFAKSDNRVKETISANVDFTTLIAKACLDSETKFLVNMESMTQHCEGIQENAQTFYAQTKVIGSKAIKVIGQDKFKVMNLALFDTYGAGDNRGKLLQTLLESSDNQQSIGLSPGDQMVDYLHKRDVVEAIIHSLSVLQSDDSGEMNLRYRIGTEEILTLRNLVSKVEKVCDRSFPISWGVREYRTGEMFNNWNFPHYLPGWKPSIVLESGLLDLKIND